MLSLNMALGVGALVFASLATEPPLQAQADRAVTAADTVVSGDLLANDAGGRGTLSIVAVIGGAVDAPFSSPAGAQVLIGSTGQFRYDPAGAFAALALGVETEERFRYRVSDGVQTAEADFVVAVIGTNRPPIAMRALPDRIVTVGEPIAPVDAAADFSDPGDVLRFSATALPTGLAIDAATGVISGVPTEVVAGRVVTVVARDIADQTATSGLQITVNEAVVATQQPLQVMAVGSRTWPQGTAITPLDLATSFDQVNGPAIDHFVVAPGSEALPAGVTMSTAGTISGTPTEGMFADRTIIMRAVTADAAFTDVTFTALATAVSPGGNLPLSSGGLVPAPMQVNTAVVSDLSTAIVNAVSLSLAPESAPMPPGFSLSGLTLTGSSATPLDFTLVLGGRNGSGADLDSQGNPLRVVLTFIVADILADKAIVSGPAWVVGTAITPFAPVFDFVPDTVTFDPLSEDLPAGLDLVAGQVVGTPSAPLAPAGMEITLIGRSATQYQRARVQAFAELPVSAFDLMNFQPVFHSGTALTITDAGPNRWRLTNNTGSAISFANYKWAVGAHDGKTLGLRVGLQPSFNLISGFGNPNVEIRIMTDPNSAASTIGAAITPPISALAYGSAERAEQPIATALPLFVRASFGNVPIGGWIELVETTLYDTALVTPLVLGTIFDETAIAVLDPAAEPWAPETVIRLKDGFWPATADIALEGDTTLAGHTFVDGILRGKPTEVGTRNYTVRATVGANSVTKAFTLTSVDAINRFPSLVDGPLGVIQPGPTKSAVTRIGQSAWRVKQVSGNPRVVQRLSGLTKGARYAISFAHSQGSTPSGTMMLAAVRKELIRGPEETDALATSWPVQVPAPTGLEFVAPSVNPWVVIEALSPPAASNWIFNGLTVTPLAGDEYVPQWKHRVEAVTVPAAGVTSRRLFNLKYGRRYRVTVGGTGDLFIARNADATQGTLPGIPDLELVTDQWAAPVTDVEFIAQEEILWLVGKNGADLSAATVTEVATVWPPAVPVPDAGQRFPFTQNYVVPSGTAQAAGISLQTFLDTTALDGTTYILADGDYSGGTVTRRFAQGVKLIAATKYGVRLTSDLTLDGARRIEIAGLYSPASLITVRNTQDVTLRHTLSHREIMGDPRAPNHWFTLLDNDIPGAITGGDFSTNPLNFTLNGATAHHMRFIGNRLWAAKSDHFRIAGQFMQFDHNLLGESYFAPGDHPDIVQPIHPLADKSDRRYNSWWAVRMNTLYDDINGPTGFDPADQGQGFTMGNQLAGLIGMDFQQNILSVRHVTWGLNPSDVHRDYRVQGNFLANKAQIALFYTHLGTFSGDISNNIVQKISDVPPDAVKLFAPADTRALNVNSDNWKLDGATGAWVDQTTIYGFAPGTASISGGHDLKGATALVAELAAQVGASDIFSPTMWEAAPGAAGEIVLTLRTLPHGSDTLLPKFDYSINDGVDWVEATDINPPFAWSQTITGLSAGVKQVKVRTRTTKAGFAFTSAASAAKAVTVN